MKDRDLILMKSLIESYVQEGTPVGSKALLKNSHLSVSPATVRNIMADLERQGLVLSPHTSAGRVPTNKGLRIFVDQLIQFREPRKDMIEKVRQNLNASQEVSKLLTNASRSLADITKMASLVQTPAKPFQRLQQIEFVPLSENRILVVLVFQNDEIQNRVIQVTHPYQRAQLEKMANFLNRQIAGQDLATAKQVLIQQMIDEKRQLDELTRQAIVLAQRGMDQKDVHSSESKTYHFTGKTNLVSMASHGQLEDLERIFHAFKQKQQVLEILERSIAADGVKIFIGEESGNQNLKNCSIVTAPYSIEGEPAGVLAVVGPTRMQYDRVVPIVDVTAKLLTSAFREKSAQH